MKKVILSIKGMSCSACSARLEKFLNKQKGIINASVNLVLAQASISYEDYLDIEDLNHFVALAGYESLGVYNPKKDKVTKHNGLLTVIVFGLLLLVVLYISMSHMLHFPSISILDIHTYPINYGLVLLVLTIPFLIYGFDLFKNGIKNLVYRSPNMDTLVTLGVIASFLYSLYNFIILLNGSNDLVNYLYFESCATIIFFIKLGRYIDSRSKEKTKEALKELVQITPNKALLKCVDGEKEVTIDEVKKGDILVCKPGMKVAVDGTIVDGESHFDEAFITGEALPTKKTINDRVVAGSINVDGYIEYKAEKIGKDSTISAIVRLVVEATNTKTSMQKIADQISLFFVPGIITIAILTLIGYLILGHSFNEALTSFVTVLVVACPCALGLATPLATVVSIGTCAKKGILVKTSDILQQAHQIDTIVFDKTGTLTYGNLKVSTIYNYSEDDDNELMSIIASLEAKVNHPISLAFTNYAKENNLIISDVSSFKQLPGLGITGKLNNKEILIGNSKLFTQLKIKNTHKEDEDNLTKAGNSIAYCFVQKKLVGLIGVNDVVRENAKDVISELKKRNIDIIMLTGDNENTAKIIADDLKIDKVVANVLPAEKVKIIKQLMRNEHKVMMVGDGINDAPSLATAHVSVSFNSATDIAADSSDVILMNDNLDKILDLLFISQRTLHIIKQNLFWAFFYNILMIPLAIGLFKPVYLSMNPMFAGIAMTISSLTVVFNSLRLKK